MTRERDMSRNLLHEFYIKDKNANKVKFYPNKAQIHYLNNRTGRDYILKARQIGFTTLEQLRKLKKVLLNPNTTVATIAHERKKTDSIFAIAKFAWDNLPERFRELYNIKYDNVREMYFAENSSRYFVDLNLRSGTVQDLHISELGFVKDIDTLFTSSLETVPKNGIITIETTANGLNRAHDIWADAMAGKNEFTPHFYNWTWDEDYFENPPEDSQWKADYKILAKKYNLIQDIQSSHQLTDSQFYWYYLKARRLHEQVKQEYPTVPAEAFLSSSISVFDLYEVNQLKASTAIRTMEGVRIFQEPSKGHTYIIGIDTAEGVGNDKTSIQVWDFNDMDNIEQVASFQDASIRPDQTAKLTQNLGIMYNNAFVIPERNSSGLTTVLKLQELGYRNLFVNKSIDKKTKKPKNEYGWRTSSTNRDVMIDDWVQAFEEGFLIIRDINTIQEMKTFVRKDNGKREHDEGYHDDNLFANFLAFQGRKYHKTARAFTTKARAFR